MKSFVYRYRHETCISPHEKEMKNLFEKFLLLPFTCKKYLILWTLFFLILRIFACSNTRVIGVKWSKNCQHCLVNACTVVIIISFHVQDYLNKWWIKMHFTSWLVVHIFLLILGIFFLFVIHPPAHGNKLM